jgi:Protein of unknown function (DUF1579)
MTTRALLAAVAMTCVGMSPVFAQQGNQPSKPMTKPAQPGMPSKQAPKGDQPGMPSQEQMQEQMEKMSKPGPNHELLNGMVGTWTCDCKFWMPPTMAEVASKGTSVNTWEMGGRFVKQEYNGSFAMAPGAPEMPFHGLGYWGYDNEKQKFVGSWMDNMSTGIMYSEGDFDAGSKTYTFNATCTDPMTGAPGKMKETVKVIDDNTHILTMSMVMDGKETKMGEITYHRKGAMDDMKPKMESPARPMKPTQPANPGKTNSPS